MFAFLCPLVLGLNLDMISSRERDIYPLYIIIIYLCLFAVWLFLSFPCRISSRSQDALMITLSDCASIRSSWTTLRPCGRRTRMRRRKLNEGCWLCSHLNQKGCLFFLFSSNHSCKVFSQRVVAAHRQICLPTVVWKQKTVFVVSIAVLFNNILPFV